MSYQRKQRATREHLTLEVNRTIAEIQTMNIGLVMAELDYEDRKKAIKNICNTKYKGIWNKVNKDVA